MKGIGYALARFATEHAGPGAISTADAVRSLAGTNDVRAADLVCPIAHVPYRFRGTIAAWREAHADTTVIAYEPCGNHHERVGVNVLFANGNVRAVRGNEYAALIRDGE